MLYHIVIIGTVSHISSIAVILMHYSIGCAERDIVKVSRMKLRMRNKPLCYRLRIPALCCIGTTVQQHLLPVAFNLFREQTAIGITYLPTVFLVLFSGLCADSLGNGCTL